MKRTIFLLFVLVTSACVGKKNNVESIQEIEPIATEIEVKGNFASILAKPFIYNYQYQDYLIEYSPETIIDTNFNIDIYNRIVGFENDLYTYAKPLTSQRVYADFCSLIVSKETWGTGYRFDQFRDGIFYRNGKYFLSTSGAGDYLEEDDINHFYNSEKYYRISGPTINTLPFKEAIQKKLDMNSVYRNIFFDDREKESILRSFLLSSFSNLQKQKYREFSYYVSEFRGLTVLYHNQGDVFLDKKAFLTNPINITYLYPIEDIIRELSTSIDENTLVYINAFICKDIEAIAQSYPGSIFLEIKAMNKTPYIVIGITIENNTYKVFYIHSYLSSDT